MESHPGDEGQLINLVITGIYKFTFLNRRSAQSIVVLKYHINNDVKRSSESKHPKFKVSPNIFFVSQFFYGWVLT